MGVFEELYIFLKEMDVALGRYERCCVLGSIKRSLEWLVSLFNFCLAPLTTSLCQKKNTTHISH